MPITIRCAHCSQSFAIADKHAGKTIKCPACSSPIPVLAAPPAPLASPAARKPSPPPAPPLAAPSPIQLSESPAAPARSKLPLIATVSAVGVLVLLSLAVLAWAFLGSSQTPLPPISAPGTAPATRARASTTFAKVPSTRAAATAAATMPGVPVLNWSATPDPCTLDPFPTDFSATLTPSDPPQSSYQARLAVQFGPFAVLSNISLGERPTGANVHQVFDLRTAKPVGAVRSGLLFADLALSPDGRYLSARCCDPSSQPQLFSLQTFSVETGKQLVLYDVPAQKLTLQVVGYAGDTAIVFDGAEFSAWDIPSARKVREIGTAFGPVAMFALSPNARFLAVVRAGTLSFSNIQTGQLLSRVPLRSLLSPPPAKAVFAKYVAFSRDGKRLLIQCAIDDSFDELLLAINTTDGTLESKTSLDYRVNTAYPAKCLPPYHLANMLSPDNKTVLLADGKMFDTAAGKFLGVITLPTSLVYSRTLAVLDADRVIAQYTHSDPFGHFDPVAASQIRDVRLVTLNITRHLGDYDPNLPLVEPGGIVNVPAFHDAFCLRFSPDGRTLAMLERRGVHLWDVPNRRLLSRFRVSNSDRTFTYTPDGNTLILTASGSAATFDLATGQTKPYHAGTLVSASADAKRLVYRNPSDVAVCSDAGNTLWTLPIDKNRLHQFSYFISPNGAYLFAHDGGTLKLWDGATGKPVELSAALKGNSSLAVAFLPDDVLFIAGQPRSTLYDLRTNSLRAQTPTSHLVITSALASPDGSVLLCGDQRNTIHFLDPKTLAEVATAQLPFLPRAMAFSPDSKTVAVSDDQRTRIYPVSHLLKEKVIPRKPLN